VSDKFSRIVVVVVVVSTAHERQMVCKFALERTNPSSLSYVQQINALLARVHVVVLHMVQGRLAVRHTPDKLSGLTSKLN
jgi:hypothetical protein